MPNITLSLPGDVIASLKSTSAETGLAVSYIVRLAVPFGLEKARRLGDQINAPLGMGLDPSSVAAPAPVQTKTPVTAPAYANPFDLVPMRRGRATWWDLELVCRAFGITVPDLVNHIDADEDIQTHNNLRWVETGSLKVAATLAPNQDLGQRILTWVLDQSQVHAPA